MSISQLKSVSYLSSKPPCLQLQHAEAQNDKSTSSMVVIDALQHHDIIGNYLRKSTDQAKPGEHGDVLSGHHLVDCLVSCCARKFYLEQTK